MIEQVSILQSSPSLGLVGDGDDIDLLLVIESSFAVSFGSETAGWFTVGDIYQALLNEFPVANEAGKCATMMAFHRVRSALSAMTASVNLRELRPSTPLKTIVTVSQKRLYQQLSSDLGLRMPRRTLSWLGSLGGFSTIAGLCVLCGLFVYPQMWPLLLLLLIGPPMVFVDPGTLGQMTIGDLSQAVATDNFHSFAQSGADHRPQWIWRALRSVIAQECGIDPASITADTRLID